MEESIMLDENKKFKTGSLNKSAINASTTIVAVKSRVSCLAFDLAFNKLHIAISSEGSLSLFFIKKDIFRLLFCLLALFL